MLTNDSYFVGFESCPDCLSRDNLSRWSDGHGWCFGCGRYEPPETSKESIAPSAPLLENQKGKSAIRTLPEDLQIQIGARGLTWLRKYGILDTELSNFRWSDSHQWLIYLIEPTMKPTWVPCWQARNFSGNGVKYISEGPVSDAFHITWGDSQSERIIVCEDIVSAIKIGRFANSMPLWGSHMPLKTITGLLERFSSLGIWLDPDKAKESLKTALRASQFGLKARSIISARDPKDYEDETIQLFLSGALGVDSRDVT